MATYRWDPGAPPHDELRRIAHRQVERALEDLQDDDRHEAVHAVRKRGKKLRALLRLVRPSAPELYQRENAAFRDATRRVSSDRDAAVALTTYETLVAGFVDASGSNGLRPVRDALVERRNAAATADLEARLDAIREDLQAALLRIPGWELEEDTGEGFEVVAGGLAKTYGRARARMEDAYDEPDSQVFHQWRKRVKYHRHHLRLLQDVWSPVLAAQRRQLHELTELLGDDHDLAVLREDLVATPERYGGDEPVATVCALLDRRRAELQADAHRLGQRCFAEPTERFVDRIDAYWRTAQEPADGPLVDATVPPGR